MKTPQQELSNRTRRAFLTMGVAAATGVGGWSWLRSRSDDEGAPWPFRRALQFNEKVAKSYFSGDHQIREFPRSVADPDTRVNGNLGLESSFDPASWSLSLDHVGASRSSLTLADLRTLPRVEQTTQLNCIEGWTAIVHWTGVRFKDFTERYAPESLKAAYVQMHTPDEQYYVGLDMASALHPQTLLCYEMNNQPLTLAHGAPLRLVIPVKYGVKNLKRIGSIIYSNERPNDYWSEQGYDWYAGL